MIFHPRFGQRVRIHYAKGTAGIMPYHGKRGVVCTIALGPGPRNAGVMIGDELVFVPRGNLVSEDAA